MPIEFNRNMYPPDGRVYMESDGTRFRGDSWRDLEAKVAEYRRLRGMPAGDVSADINAQLCAKYPSFCGDTSPRPIANAHSLTFNQRVLHWVAHMLGVKRSNPTLFTRASDEEAAARAAICARCPAQQGLVQSCEACIRSVETGRRVLLDGAPSRHQNLLPCRVLAEDTTVTVHLNQPAVDVAELPAECWRKRR